MLYYSYLAGYLYYFVHEADSVLIGASDAAISVIYIHSRMGSRAVHAPLFVWS